MQHIIIGEGEIGKALKGIFKDADIHDTDPLPARHYDVLHISFPYSKKFVKAVKSYQKRYTPTYTVIHSTVPVGTTRKVNASHSPVTGKHPDLKESILTFKKFVGGAGAEQIAKEFEKYSIQTEVFNSSEETEASKLWELTMFGVNVLIQKDIYKYCEKNDLDFNNVYKKMVDKYNTGYKVMGMEQFQMYNLNYQDGKIGGHCVIQNAKSLNNFWGNLLIGKNKKL